MNTLHLFAQHVVIWSQPRTWGITEFAIAVVVIAAVIALVMIALGKFGVQIPDWVKQVFWILVIAFVIIFAIRFVSSM